MNLLRRPVFAWGLVIIWAGGIWFGSNISLGSESPFRFFGVDKMGHVAEFGLLGLLAANALLSRSPLPAGILGRESAGHGAVLLAGIWGWIDEIHQFWVPGRNTDPLDLVADVVGAAIGAWICLRWIRPPERTNRSSEVAS